jgi:SAM-dependent methyltransferase
MINLPYTHAPTRFDEFGRPCFGELHQEKGLAQDTDLGIISPQIAAGYTTAVNTVLVGDLHRRIEERGAVDVLEIGGGRGKLFDRVADGIKTFVNVEPDHLGGDGAQRLQHPKYQCLRCSAEAIPLPSESVDLIVSLAAFDHIPDTRRALAEVRRLLRPNGCFILILNNRGSWWKTLLWWTPIGRRRAQRIAHDHYIQWSVRDARAAVGEYLAIVSASTYTFFPYVPHVWPWVLPAADAIGRRILPWRGANMVIVAERR